jgi:hypothetical protein
MPSKNGFPHTIKDKTTIPETISRMPFRRSHQVIFIPSSGRGSPKLCVADLGFEMYIKPIATIAIATSSAMPKENQYIANSLFVHIYKLHGIAMLDLQALIDYRMKHFIWEINCGDDAAERKATR